MLFMERAEWQARDEVFRTFTNELFDGRYSDKKIERLRKWKYGEKLKFHEKAGVVISGVGELVFHKVKSRQPVKQEKLLSPLDEREREAVELALGLNVCGVPPDQNQIVEQMHSDLSEVDNLLYSAQAKLRSPQNPY